MDLSKLSKEELDALEAKIAEEKASQERKKREAIDTYKELVSDAVEEAFVTLQDQSRMLAVTKAGIYKLFEAVKEMKADLYKVKENGQWSHTFSDKDGNKRIILGTNTLDNYDDTANNGIAMVNEYLDSLAENNPNAEQAVKICRSLMARDRKGNLKPSKIVTLYNHARKSYNPKFLEGVETIMSAYKPVASKTYVRAEYKNDKGEWVNVPLGMTEA